MDGPKIRKVKNRWGCQYHEIPKLTELKLPSCLLNKINQSRESGLQNGINDAKRFADPGEFNSEISKSCEALGTGHRIDAMMFHTREKRKELRTEKTQLDDTKNKSQPGGDSSEFNFFSEPASGDFFYAEDEFPSLDDKSGDYNALNVPEEEKAITADMNADLKLDFCKDGEAGFSCLIISGFPTNGVDNELITSYLDCFGEILKVESFVSDDGITAHVWIAKSACEWVISCLDGQPDRIKGQDVVLRVKYA